VRIILPPKVFCDSLNVRGSFSAGALLLDLVAKKNRHVDTWQSKSQILIVLVLIDATKMQVVEHIGLIISGYALGGGKRQLTSAR